MIDVAEEGERPTPLIEFFREKRIGVSRAKGDETSQHKTQPGPATCDVDDNAQDTENSSAHHSADCHRPCRVEPHLRIVIGHGELSLLDS